MKEPNTTPETTKFINRWYRRRGKEVRPYLTGAILRALQSRKKRVVLAACPGAGKTWMSICIADYNIKANPTMRILVLTHGTSTLRSQYAEDLLEANPDFTFQNLEAGGKMSDAQVVITLPQTIINLKTLPHFDLLIVDEAHQFYFASMVKRIEKRINPSHVLLLTGSPYKFVNNEDYDIIPVTLGSLLRGGYVQDVIIELTKTDYNYNERNYFRDELRGLKTTQIQTNSTLDYALEDLHVKFGGWKNAGKTLIACRTQAQALQAAKYFKKKKIGHIISTSDTDIDSTEIKKFKSHPDLLILIVVNRGILGYNFPAMKNVVDISGTKNLNKLFQMVCRLVRKNGSIKKFIKVVPESMKEHFKLIMTCVLCLSEEEWYLNYNGSNVLGLKIPIEGKKKKTKGNFFTNIIIGNAYLEQLEKLRDSEEAIKMVAHDMGISESEVKAALENQEAFEDNTLEDKKPNKTDKAKSVKLIDFLGMPSISLFSEIIRGTNYATTTIRKAQEIILEARVTWDEESILEEVKKCKTSGEWAIKSPGSYQSARRRGDDFIQKCLSYVTHRTPNLSSKDDVVASAKKFTSSMAWREGDRRSYDKAYKHGWYFEISRQMGWANDMGYTIADLQEIVKLGKYKSREDWHRKHQKSWSYAQRKKLLDIVFPLRYKWTKESIIETAKKCKSHAIFAKKYHGAYKAATKLGIREEIKKLFK